ncbi:MAG: flagellar hook-associated protein FlgL [Lachnospiraceae bacterium]|nr:flagellar hook-associated protein FlgL [Lachnospiraceae bacterium]
MAMRITTKMMQSTSLSNINTNKALQEKLTTQMSTQKKITRPSDDPVIAIRSLRLNASLNKIDQYYEKNTEDAKSWLTLTEAAIKTTSDLLTEMKTNITQAANGYLTEKDRQAIMENLSNYKKEVYATGNADSAGRSIFTGYRTDSSLTFQSDKTERYEIIEQRNNTFIDMTTFVRTKDLSTINEGNFNTVNTTEYQVDTYEIPRIRAAYADLDIDKDIKTGELSADASLSYMATTGRAFVNDKLGASMSTSYGSVFMEELAMPADQMRFVITDNNGTKQEMFLNKGQSTTITTSGGDLEISFNIKKGETTVTVDELDAQGNVVRDYTMKATEGTNELGQPIYAFEDTYETSITVTDLYESGSDEAYEAAMNDEKSIVYIAETGEFLLGSDIYEELSKLSQDTEIRLGYEKTNWQSGDLDPIHYFYSVREDELRGEVVYNQDKLDNPETDNADQIISYDIGSNQTIRVNTTADEVFTHNIGRDIDELVAMLDEYATLDGTYNTVNNMIKSEEYEGAELEKLEAQLAALDKARTLLGDKIQFTSESLQTTFNGYIEDTTLAYTDCGSRSSRLKLIQNRLASQQTNFEELVSSNEDADITDLAIQLSSVKLTYEAALSSISYVMQTSLLDYI